MNADATRDPPRTGTPESPSTALLTVPNVLTFLRMALLPLFAWIALGPHRLGVAVVLGIVIGFSDFFDGLLARRLHQVSYLGITLDPLFDRLAVGATVVVLIGLHLVPWPVTVVVLARDVFLVAGGVILLRRGYQRPPVTRIGKWGSFDTMWGLGLLLASGIDARIRHPYRIIGWGCLGAGILFSYAAALGYARSILRAVRSREAGG